MNNILFPQLVWQQKSKRKAKVKKTKPKKLKAKPISIFQLMNQVSKGTNTLIRGVSDFDGDGVPNRKDCQPLNRKKQHNDRKTITQKDIELIDKSLLRGKEYSDLSYSEFVNLMKARTRRFPIIQVVRGYGIFRMQDRGQIFYNAIDMNTGMGIFSGRESLEEAIEDIKKGVPEQLKKDNPEIYNVSAAYEWIKQSSKAEKKYGGRAKRFKKIIGQKVLDIGAGDNPDVRATHAIDLYKPGKTFKNLDYKWGYDLSRESTNLPYRDNSFNVVVSYGGLGLNFETANIYREIYRILKPDGYLELNQSSPNTRILLKNAGFEKPRTKSYFDESLGERISVLVAKKV